MAKSAEEEINDSIQELENKNGQLDKKLNQLKKETGKLNENKQQSLTQMMDEIKKQMLNLEKK